MSELARVMREMRDWRAPHLNDVVIEMAARDPSGDIDSLAAFFRARGKSMSADDLSILFSMRSEALNAGADRDPGGPPRLSGRTVADKRSAVIRAAPEPAPATASGQHRATASGSAAEARRPQLDADLPDLDTFATATDFVKATDHGLKLRSRNGRVTVRWPIAPAPTGMHAVYLVTAAKSAVPRRPDEHLRQGATTATELEIDDSAVYVAVFVYFVGNLDEVEFSRCVRHAVGRVVNDVSNLAAVPQTRAVLLTWTTPPGVDRVRVLRSLANQELPDIPDDSLLVDVSGDVHLDENLQPGATYTYRVYTEAAGLGAAAGSIEVSGGVVTSVKVPSAVEAVSSIDGWVEQRDHDAGVTLSWPALAAGTVAIFERAGLPDPDVPVGVVLTVDQFARWQGQIGSQIRDPISTQDGRQVLKWLPLQALPGRDDEPRRTFTAVTMIDDHILIGAQKVVTYIGPIVEAEIDERVDWQLLRATWPVGASFLGVWSVPPGTAASGRPDRQVTRDEFDREGGIRFSNLSYHAQDLVVQGASHYDGKWETGEAKTIEYPGRWVLRYKLEPVGFMRQSRVLLVSVERPDWPEISLGLVSSAHGFVLSPDDPDLAVVHRGRHPEASLPVNDYVTVGEPFKLRRDHLYTRLFVTARGVTPIVVDPLDSAVAAPIGPLTPQMRCHRCLVGSDLHGQLFRCAGTCAPRPDPELSALSGKETWAPPVFYLPRVQAQGTKEVTLPPVESATCPTCNRASDIQVCIYCHSTLAPHWWTHDVLGVTVVGARSSGKTSYLRVLVKELENNAVPSIHGLHPVNAESEATLNAMREGLSRGQLESSTIGSVANEAILQPTLLNVGTSPSGRTRTLSIFDVAGEDMTSAERVRPYGAAMAGADVLIVLIDPLQLEGVRAWLNGKIQLPPQAPLRAATLLQNVIAQIRLTRHIPAGRIGQHVAIGFSKFDGLQSAANVSGSKIARLIGPGTAMWRDPYGPRPSDYLEADGHRMHDEVKALLEHVGEGSLISVAESNFTDVRYIALSALGHAPKQKMMISQAGASPHRVADPVRWLLWLNGWK